MTSGQNVKSPVYVTDEASYYRPWFDTLERRKIDLMASRGDLLFQSRDGTAIYFLITGLVLVAWVVTGIRNWLDK